MSDGYGVPEIQLRHCFGNFWWFFILKLPQLLQNRSLFKPILLLISVTMCYLKNRFWVKLQDPSLRISTAGVSISWKWWSLNVCRPEVCDKTLKRDFILFKVNWNTKKVKFIETADLFASKADKVALSSSHSAQRLKNLVFEMKKESKRWNILFIALFLHFQTRIVRFEINVLALKILVSKWWHHQQVSYLVRKIYLLFISLIPQGDSPKAWLHYSAKFLM